MHPPVTTDAASLPAILTTPPVVASWERVPPSRGDRPELPYPYGAAGRPLLATDPQYVDVYA